LTYTLIDSGLRCNKLAERRICRLIVIAINNPADDVDLVLAGNGYFISGQFMAGVRPITIASDTTVTMQNITIVGLSLPLVVV
jgi:hypothetical protein